VIFFILPPILPSYLQSMLTKVVIFAIFSLSLNLIWGGGLISLGHASYFGVAAYISAILMTRMGIENFWITAGAGMLAAGILAAFFGFFALRVSGIYFLMVTLALGQLVFFASMALRSITGGMNGLSGLPWPNLGFIEFEWNRIYFYYFVLIIAAICTFILYRIFNSPFGYALRGIHHEETKMETLGVNTWLTKYMAFIIGGVFAAVAGILFSYFLGMVSPSQLSVKTSTLAVLMLIIGSSTVFWGPIVGAVLVVLLEYFASIYIPARWPLVLGATFIVSVMFLRGGIALYLRKFWRRVTA
jgi:branched-chain amino acid transport system permease protein